MPDFLTAGPEGAKAALLLAHGAGAGMESPFMVQIAGLLAERGVRTLRFEFAYMAARRDGGKRRPPPKADLLTGEYKAAIAAASAVMPKARLGIGGKSMGGRVASYVADELFSTDDVQALVCIGYPFHPPNKPAQLRTAHLEHCSVRRLSCKASAIRSAARMRLRATSSRAASAGTGRATATTIWDHAAHRASRARATWPPPPTPSRIFCSSLDHGRLHADLLRQPARQ